MIFNSIRVEETETKTNGLYMTLKEIMFMIKLVSNRYNYGQRVSLLKLFRLGKAARTTKLNKVISLIPWQCCALPQAAGDHTY
jgi:hypothetical protein